MVKIECLNGHVLCMKKVAGSWFRECKKCSRCGYELRAGVVRHSCKRCKYHLCVACHSELTEEYLQGQISITIYRATPPGSFLEPDAWQVRIHREATVGMLKGCIEELYGVQRQLQILRRDPDGAHLRDDEHLGCEDDDLLHLCFADPFLPIQPLMGNADAAELAAFVDAYTLLAQGPTLDNPFPHQSLEGTMCTLTFVKLSPFSRVEEKRCSLEVAVSSRVLEVLEMVKLELDVQADDLALEFGGVLIPVHSTIHELNACDCDVIMVVHTHANAFGA